MVGEQDLAVYLSKFDKKYWLTYKVLDILQKVTRNFTRVQRTLCLMAFCTQDLHTLHGSVLGHVLT